MMMKTRIGNVLPEGRLAATALSRNACRRTRLAVLGFVACIIGLLLHTAIIHAQEIEPASTHSYTYGENITFSLVFPSEPRPAEVQLYLQIPGQPVHSYGASQEGTTFLVVRDLIETPLPPFAEIVYWWRYSSSVRNQIETEKHTLRYIDNRFVWQSATEKGITLHWIAGERTDMMRGLDIASRTLDEIQWALQARPKSGVNIYIYPSQTDLLSAMQIAGLEWVGGSAYPDISVILITVPPTTEGIFNMDRDLPHELTHVALYTALGSQGYASLPTWLSEGLAAHFEARPNPNYASSLTQAQQSGALIPLSELCAPFPDDANRALLAYAQSTSFVNYLRQTYGWSSVRDLLETYADGMACSTGAQEALGLDIVQLDREWRVWLEGKSDRSLESSLPATMTVLIRDTGPWLLILGALLIPGVMLLITGRR